ncbi:neutral alpha-glucosidase AB-like isoform X2 [Dreissena polymorpha]|uniref:neutral alpha-glucosidase AB-like isoform X2 n=1 Tax=Dreissena polymorpha TaxID=45954 RepID=UPI002263B041|nr:neutral alpha-glucosidase AB-like isoform X2 [Dreissena polymorpha]
MRIYGCTRNVIVKMALSAEVFRRRNTRMPQLSALLLGLMLTHLASAVSKDNFKTCDQSGFCKRHRAMQPGASPYVVLMDTLKIQPTTMEVQVHNTKNNVRLLLQVTALKFNSARFKINELNPIRKRYEIPVGDALVGEPKQQDLKVLERTDASITLGFEQNKIRITGAPFRIDFISNEEPVISINSQGLFKFEHFREKSPQQPPAEENQDEKPEEQANGDVVEMEIKKMAGEGGEAGEKKQDMPPKEEEEPGMWEETFKNFHDSKPYGPSSVGIDISFPGFEHVYGIPEHADSMALKTTKSGDPYRLFNLDVFEYELYNPMALYGSVPVMLAHNEKRTVGIFWHNAAETWIDISSNTADKNFLSKIADMVGGGSKELPQTDTHWISESGVVDVFIMLGPTAQDVFYQYAQLTGTTNLPPLFGISYHQCRWNYNDQDDVKSVDANFDVYDIPYDVIWLDIEHTNGKRYFTWDPAKFPNSEEMINNVASKGRKMVTIVDPHLKSDSNYGVYVEARDKGYNVKNKDGGDYDGWCWPGSSSWPDFTNPEVRKWWASKFLFEEYKGSTPSLFTWNDMNEPSVFNGPEITFHKDVKHMDGFENRDLHNMYGFYVQQATAEGQLLRSNNQERFFVLTRAFFAGSQRWGSAWTGDNMGDWSHLKVSNPMMLSLNLVGITHSGADIGGFFKNPDTELLTRWYQAGAYQPFFRAHAHVDTKRREPFVQPEENMKIIRDAIRARYSYLPFWYTLFYEGEQKGVPPMRPLWVEFPKDPNTFTMDDEYLLGSALLVKPITEPGQTGTQVYFPDMDGVWYDIDTYKAYQGGQSTYVEAPLSKIPVFQRGGTIVPRKLRIRRSSSLMVHDPFTLVVCLNKNGFANGSLYVDDYHTFNYRKGEYILRYFTFEHNELLSQLGDQFGKTATREWVEKVIIVGLKAEPKSVTLRSKGVESYLAWSFNSASGQLIIRKPGVNIATDFSIKLS